MAAAYRSVPEPVFVASQLVPRGSGSRLTQVFGRRNSSASLAPIVMDTRSVSADSASYWGGVPACADRVKSRAVAPEHVTSVSSAPSTSAATLG